MYQDNDKFLMPWGKYQGIPISEMVKKDPDYAKFIVKPKEEILRIIQELETQTQNQIPTEANQEDVPGPGDRPF